MRGLGRTNKAGKRATIKPPPVKDPLTNMSGSVNKGKAKIDFDKPFFKNIFEYDMYGG